MASILMGRTKCPLCGNEAAHVKLKTDKKDGKEALPYVFCPEERCRLLWHTKTRAQAEMLAQITRPEKGVQVPVRAPTPTEKTAPVEVEEDDAPPTPTHPPKPASFLDGLFQWGQS